jgi:hypothetical protein
MVSFSEMIKQKSPLGYTQWHQVFENFKDGDSGFGKLQSRAHLKFSQLCDVIHYKLNDIMLLKIARQAKRVRLDSKTDIIRCSRANSARRTQEGCWLLASRLHKLKNSSMHVDLGDIPSMTWCAAWLEVHSGLLSCLAFSITKRHHKFKKISMRLAFYIRERWIWGCFIVSHAARMASNAGNDEIILLFSAREISPNRFFELHFRTRYRPHQNFQKLDDIQYIWKRCYAVKFLFRLTRQ